MSRLETVVNEFKFHIADSVEEALKYLQKVLSTSSTRFNDYIQIKSRFNSLQRELLLGTISNDEFNKARNNISAALLLFADDIREADLVEDGKPKSGEGPKRGELLYNIPDVMAIGREEKCTVRIAWVLEQLLRGWEKSEEDVIKNIRISDVMAVELLNAEFNNPFEIRTLSEKVQFIDQYEFTEWIFYVKPVMEGSYTLALRVSVIEMINDKEYKKDIVLEEEIVVKTEAPEQEASFKKADAGIMMGSSPAAPSSRSADLEMAPPPSPQAPPAAAPAAPAPSSSSGGNAFKMIVVLIIGSAGLALAYFGAGYYLEGRAYDELSMDRSRSGYRKYLDEYPDGRFKEEAQAALSRLDEEERLMAEAVRADTAHIVDVEVDVPFDSTLLQQPATPSSEVETSVKPARPKRRPGKSPLIVDSIKKEPAPSVENKDVQPLKPQGEVQTKELPATRLRGEKEFYFKMSAFLLARKEDTAYELRFLKYNEFGDVMLILGIKGAWELAPGQILELVTASNKKIAVNIRYSSKSPDRQGQTEGYFAIGPEVLKLLCETDVRVMTLSAPDSRSTSVTLNKRNQRDLRIKAREAAAKVQER
jgi:hypothetical protein